MIRKFLHRTRYILGPPSGDHAHQEAAAKFEASKSLLPPRQHKTIRASHGGGDALAGAESAEPEEGHDKAHHGADRPGKGRDARRRHDDLRARRPAVGRRSSYGRIAAEAGEGEGEEASWDGEGGQGQGRGRGHGHDADDGAEELDAGLEGFPLQGRTAAEVEDQSLDSFRTPLPEALREEFLKPLASRRIRWRRRQPPLPAPSVSPSGAVESLRWKSWLFASRIDAFPPAAPPGTFAGRIRLRGLPPPAAVSMPPLPTRFPFGWAPKAAASAFAPGEHPVLAAIPRRSYLAFDAAALPTRLGGRAIAPRRAYALPSMASADPSAKVLGAFLGAGAVPPRKAYAPPSMAAFVPFAERVKPLVPWTPDAVAPIAARSSADRRAAFPSRSSRSVDDLRSGLWHGRKASRGAEAPARMAGVG